MGHHTSGLCTSECPFKLGAALTESSHYHVPLTCILYLLHSLQFTQLSPWHPKGSLQGPPGRLLHYGTYWVIVLCLPLIMLQT
jgi:hypothetical protein